MGFQNALGSTFWKSFLTTKLVDVLFFSSKNENHSQVVYTAIDNYSQQVNNIIFLNNEYNFLTPQGRQALLVFVVFLPTMLVRQENQANLNAKILKSLNSMKLSHQAHNLKVVGSNPTPATKITHLNQRLTPLSSIFLQFFLNVPF